MCRRDFVKWADDVRCIHDARVLRAERAACLQHARASSRVYAGKVKTQCIAVKWRMASEVCSAHAIDDRSLRRSQVRGGSRRQDQCMTWRRIEGLDRRWRRVTISVLPSRARYLCARTSPPPIGPRIGSIADAMRQPGHHKICQTHKTASERANGRANHSRHVHRIAALLHAAIDACRLESSGPSA